MSLHRPLLLGLLAGALLLPAAQAKDTQKAGRLYEDALKRYSANDVNGAVIQLKNALQADRGFVPALLLMGRASLDNSNPGAAEGALIEALRLGASRNEVAAPLARALLAQGKHQFMLDDPRLQPQGLTAIAAFELLLIRGAAQSDLGNERAALASIEQARALNPGSAGSWTAEVPVRIRAGALDQALAAADRALQLAPQQAEAHYQRGSVLHVQGQLAAAQAAYDEALRRQPDHLEALIARAGIHADRGEIDAALADIARLRKSFPREPRADYLAAVIAEGRGDRKSAQASMRRVAELIDAAPPEFLRYRSQLLMLGGLSHHALNQPEKAKPFLETLVRQQPRNPASKLLAQMLYDEGQVENGIALLEAYLRLQPQDIQAVVLLAAGHSAQGRHAKATQLMSQALAQRDSPELRGALGQTLMRSGRFGEAQKELESAWERAGKRGSAGVPLVMLYLRTQQPAKAVAVAKLLAEQQPSQASLQHLLGMALAAQGDSKGARARFEQALQLEPELSEAQMSLARLEARSGEWGAAQQRLEALHARDPKAIEPMLELAQLLQGREQPETAERWLERAVAAAGARELRPSFALAELQLRRGLIPRALETAKNLYGKAPENPAALIAYARALMAANQAVTARPLLVQASRRLPTNDAVGMAEVAGMQLDANDLPAAAYSAAKALETEPRLPRALIVAATVEMRRNDLKAAAAPVAQLLAARPRDATSHLLAAELSLAQNKPAEALAALRRAHELQPSTATAMRLVLHLSRFDSGNGAQSVAEAWLKRQPNDLTVRRALAELLSSRQQWAGARAAYEALLRANANDAQSLNNLALVMLQLKDVAAARVHSERALKLAPSNPIALDTHAWVLHRSGRHEEALGLLRDARARAPDHAEIRYHLAAVLAQLGRQAEARTEIQAALAAPQGLESVKDAQALAATLLK